MRIRDLESDSDSSNEEVKEEYISLNTPLATLVSAARLNRAKQGEVFEK